MRSGRGFRRRFSGEGSGEGSGRLWCRANRVPEKVPEKVWEVLVHSPVKFNRICGHLTHGNPAEVFAALGFAARFEKICKNNTLRLLGIPPKLISYSLSHNLFQNAQNIVFSQVDAAGLSRPIFSYPLIHD